jgi:hypothetical protein
VGGDGMNDERSLFDGFKHFCHGNKVPKWRGCCKAGADYGTWVGKVLGIVWLRV